MSYDVTRLNRDLAKCANKKEDEMLYVDKAGQLAVRKKHGLIGKLSGWSGSKALAAYMNKMIEVASRMVPQSGLDENIYLKLTQVDPLVRKHLESLPKNERDQVSIEYHTIIEEGKQKIENDTLIRGVPPKVLLHVIVDAMKEETKDPRIAKIADLFDRNIEGITKLD